GLNYDLFYNLLEFELLSSPTTWYLGPSLEYFEQEIASRFSSNHQAFSELIMVSAGLNTRIITDISKKFSISFFLRTNLIGVSDKTHDERKFKDHDTKLQTLFIANNINSDLAVNYKALKWLSLGLKAKAQYTRSTGWDKSVSFTNSGLFYTTVHF
nr:hypothetical protein [Bacteroidota bacterium]